MVKVGFIKGYGINYSGTISKIKKNENSLQPIFEAITNSFESLKLKTNDTSIKTILISVNLSKNLFSDQQENFNFNEILIEDNGIGVNDREFERLISLNDDRKGFSNKGTGRVQFLHFFDKTTISSIYENTESSVGYSKRILELSKKKPFLDQNAIVKYISNEESIEKPIKTSVSFIDPLSDNDKSLYCSLTTQILKEEIISHYLDYFCENRNNLPIIEIQITVDNKLKERVAINSSDIPDIEYETGFNINYSEFSTDSNQIQTTTEFEKFNLKSFKIHKEKLLKNKLILTSKGELASNIKLNNLLPQDQINNMRYLFLLSGEYIDGKDSDSRGDLRIPLRAEFKKDQQTLFNNREIILEDIEESTNKVIEDYYSEIKKKKEDKEVNIEKLKKMFLLNDETLKSLNIGINDTDDDILKKVYQSDAKIIAKRDANIKKQIEQIEKLDTNSVSYKDDLETQINELVTTIPQQNRTALTHYVARRKLVLELFDKILKKQLELLKNGERIDEDLMHNLIFQQASDDPSKSDLWILNEEFIYFTGCSEHKFSKVKIGGELLFKKEFEEEEERYLNSLGERRLDKRPDILLFPEEGKCIIIEFKAPDVNASVHLTQIDKYANLIRNYTKEKFQITRFYGYLIGESIEPRDVTGTVTRYEESPNFKYLFRPSENVSGYDGRKNGSIYSEVIKYSTLLERAQLRNKVFIDKLTE